MTNQISLADKTRRLMFGNEIGYGPPTTGQPSPFRSGGTGVLGGGLAGPTLLRWDGRARGGGAGWPLSAPVGRACSGGGGLAGPTLLRWDGRARGGGAGWPLSAPVGRACSGGGAGWPLSAPVGRTKARCATGDHHTASAGPEPLLRQTEAGRAWNM